MCLPLKDRGAVRGVLTLFRCGPRQAFSMAEAQAQAQAQAQAMDMMSRHLAPAMRPRA
ncbi:hypothetical protein P2Q00_00940 [Streptomyces coacervatus]|uniref:hypothetical protein n=1 Tax=Streptomyces coacervatus TaxID=647381 RepID=UPI0023D9B68F|nr:hypothetical protein [Streptomyces coacervatus]MDF2264006.1 hypothetical protein [Streptomyces coacervatus]